MKKLINIAAAFTLTIFWLALISTVLPYFINSDMFGRNSLTPLGIFFFSCILAPLWEELAFRHGPLLIAKKLKENSIGDFTWPIVIISSALFGWGHGAGPISILIQGVGGLILSWVYLKNNYSYWSSTLLHFLWNTSLYYIFPIFSAQYGIKIW